MRHHRIASIGVTLLTCITCVVIPVSSQPLSVATSIKSDTSVTADDNLDAYVGTGGLLLPALFDGDAHTRKAVADCLACIWKYSLFCEEGAEFACAHATTTCPPKMMRYRVKFGHSLSTLSTVGSVCWGFDEPPTRVKVMREIRSTQMRRVPPLVPGYWPDNECLTYVPIRAWSGQPQLFRPRSMRVGGFKISITASAMWNWSWGDGTTQWTGNPGAYRAASPLSHAYSRPGRYKIWVHTIWSARYSIDGIGTYTLNEGPINQDSSLHLDVLASSPVLVRH